MTIAGFCQSFPRSFLLSSSWPKNSKKPLKQGLKGIYFKVVFFISADFFKFYLLKS